MKKKEFLKIFIIFLVSSLLAFILSFLADQFLEYDPSFPYATKRLPLYNLSRPIYSFAGFDGIHYLTIAERGYKDTDLIQAFFPLYPLILRFINKLINNTVISGIILGQIFSLTTLISFYLLLKEEYKEKIALRTVFIFAFFLSSFYLKMLYNEGLFLTLIFSSLLAAKKEKHLLAGILGAFASATRIVGVFIFPALAIMDWTKTKKINWKKVLAYSISAFGLLAYMFYLQREFNDPLYFFHVQNEFGASRQTSLVLFPQVIWRYFKILWTVRPFDLKYFAYLQEFLVSLWALYILIKASIKNYQKKIKIEWGYLVFAFGAYFLPTLTGNFSSMPRYVLVCFPIFIYLAQIWQKNKKKWPIILYLTINLVLLIINTVLFIQGYWVA